MFKPQKVSLLLCLLRACKQAKASKLNQGKLSPLFLPWLDSLSKSADVRLNQGKISLWAVVG